MVVSTAYFTDVSGTNTESIVIVKELKINIQSSIMDRQRLLLVNRSYVEFDENDQVYSVPTRFENEDIVGIRYGVKPIMGYIFRIGRIYCIDIRNDSNKIIRIRMKTIYKIRLKKLEAKYIEIVEALFANIYYDLVEHYINLFSSNLPFEVLGIGFRTEGLILKSDDPIVLWDDLGTKDYITYFALYSKSNAKRYRAFSYLEDWNTRILYSVSRYILQQKDIWK